MRRHTLNSTGVNRDGYTCLPRTHVRDTNNVLSQVEEGLSYLYYSTLRNDNGLKDPAKDKATAIEFFKAAISLLEAQS